MQILIKGIKTNYIEAGEGDSILLLHGWGSNIGLFQQLIGHLSRAHRVFALDMPGFGETEEPKEPWCVDDYCLLYTSKGRHEKVLDHAKRSGYVRVRVDGSMYELSEEIQLDKNIKHNIEVVVDRLVIKPGIQKRLTDSIENVMQLSEGLMTVDVIGGEPMNFSQSFSCPDCGISIDEVEPRSFSFNNPFGACPECLGLGYKLSLIHI